MSHRSLPSRGPSTLQSPPPPLIPCHFLPFMSFLYTITHTRLQLHPVAVHTSRDRRVPGSYGERAETVVREAKGTESGTMPERYTERQSEPRRERP